MRPWSKLNHEGRFLLICCIVNILVSLVSVLGGNYAWIFSILIAMFCGLSTYNSKYDKK